MFTGLKVLKKLSYKRAARKMLVKSKLGLPNALADVTSKQTDGEGNVCEYEYEQNDEKVLAEHQSQKYEGRKAASDVGKVKEKSFEGDPEIWDFFLSG